MPNTRTFLLKINLLPLIQYHKSELQVQIQQDDLQATLLPMQQQEGISEHFCAQAATSRVCIQQLFPCPSVIVGDFETLLQAYATCLCTPGNLYNLERVVSSLHSTSSGNGKPAFYGRGENSKEGKPIKVFSLVPLGDSWIAVGLPPQGSRVNRYFPRFSKI